jgi:ribosomal protein L25 (general stress protein Ctc)
VQFTLDEHSKKIASIQIEQKEHNVVAQDIQTRLASIETSLKYIEQMVKK